MRPTVGAASLCGGLCVEPLGWCWLDMGCAGLLGAGAMVLGFHRPPPLCVGPRPFDVSRCWVCLDVVSSVLLYPSPPTVDTVRSLPSNGLLRGDYSASDLCGSYEGGV